MRLRMPRLRSKNPSVHISRLTIPSSGPAYGSPLKSNVRRLWSRLARPSVQARVAALSRAHLASQSSPTRALLLPCRRIARHGLRGPSVPLRWRPAHGTRSAISLRSRSARHAARFGLPRERDRKLRPRRFGRSSISLGEPHAASSLATFEATIEHARTVLLRSLCFSCAAHLPFVAYTRLACICACLAFEARTRRFSSAA